MALLRKRASASPMINLRLTDGSRITINNLSPNNNLGELLVHISTILGPMPGYPRGLPLLNMMLAFAGHMVYNGSYNDTLQQLADLGLFPTTAENPVVTLLIRSDYGALNTSKRRYNELNDAIFQIMANTFTGGSASEEQFEEFQREMAPLIANIAAERAVYENMRKLDAELKVHPDELNLIIQKETAIENELIRLTALRDDILKERLDLYAVPTGLDKLNHDIAYYNDLLYKTRSDRELSQVYEFGG